MEVPAMTKPFDVQNLMARAKAKGLDLAEDAAKMLVGETLDWTQESCLLHENPMVKGLSAVVGVLKQPAMEQLDKIDGKVG